MSIQGLPEYKCPGCGRVLDACTLPEDMDSPVRPKPGDFSVCFGCGEILVFEEGGTLHQAKISELMALSPFQRAHLTWAQKTIMKMRPLDKDT